MIAIRLLCLLLLTGTAYGEEEDPDVWLMKLNDAVQSLNYEGTFVFMRGDRLDTMRILHRYDESGVKEKLVSLNGERRQLIRDRDVLTCIWPSSRSVVVENSQRIQHGVPAAIPMNTKSLEPYYKIKLGDTDRIAGIECRYINIVPVDHYRYGRDFCVAVDSGMLMKSVVLDKDGQAIESMMFTDIRLPSEIPAAQFEPDIKGEEYTWHTVAAREHLVAQAADPAWMIKELPPGFEIRENATKLIAASREPVQHIVLSDGLASISIFIDKKPEPAVGSNAAPMRGGAMHTFQKETENHQITVVGEAPEETVQMVAAGLHYQR